MFERELGVSLLLDFDHERHSSFRAAKRERLADVFVRDGVHVPEIAIRTALDHSSTKLGFLVGIMETNDLKRDTRIMPRVFCFERAFSRADENTVTFAAHPNGDALGRTVRHQGGEMGEIGAVEQSFDFFGKLQCHKKCPCEDGVLRHDLMKECLNKQTSRTQIRADSRFKMSRLT